MPHPGPEQGFDYKDLPYVENWRPIPDREWAVQYCKSMPGDRDDEFGFQQQLRMEVPYLFSGHSAPSWVPDVDHFVRHDRKGVRQDVNWKLARQDKPPEIIAALKAKENEQTKQDWQQAQEAHERASSPPAEKPPLTEKLPLKEETPTSSTGNMSTHLNRERIKEALREPNK